jgi:tetratricopeptide (TPR) repeat protein
LPSPPNSAGERLYELFHAALGLPPEGRRAYLEVACANCPGLLADVTDLLEHDRAADGDGFFDTIASDLDRPGEAGAPLAPSLAGRRVGPYEVRERLASGGMGAVFRAVRVDDYEQVVALKVLRSELFTEELRDRFRNERQALAQLAHPNIARLLDGGTTADGLPYLVMEYIAGRRIDAHCDDEQLPVRERLVVFRQVCAAVQYAHGRGILHRDLKPANILVTRDGTPKLTDFGLAKRAGHDAGQTLSGQVLGTPSYMAPEQATSSRDTNAAADVYSLGAVLYELLTGRPPFKGATWRDTLEQVCGQEPVPPRRLQPGLSRDLETICLKCLQKDPARRYPSAAALDDDIGRALAGQPIHARPVGPAGRLVRWCRRSPRVAALGAALVLTVLAALAGVTTLWRLSVRREVALAEKTAEADRERARAEARQRLARRSVDDMYTWVAQRLLAHEPGLTAQRRAFLEKALALYEEFAREEGDDPEVRFKTSQAYYYVATIQGQLGRLTEAEAAYARQIAILRGLADEFPHDRDYRFDLFYSHMCLGNVLVALGRLDEADDAQYRAHDHIRRLAADFPDDPIYQDALACQSLNVGGRLAAHGDAVEAERLYDQALAIAQKLDRDHPDRTEPPDYGHNVALAFASRGGLRQGGGRLDEAEADYREAVAASQALRRKRPDERTYVLELAQFQGALAALSAVRGRPDEAERLFAEAVRPLEALAADFPDLVAYRHSAASLHRGRGFALVAAGRDRQAEEPLRRSRELLDAIVKEHPDMVWVKDGLAWDLCVNPVPALRDPARARELAAEVLRQHHDESVYARTLGVARYREGDLEGCVADLTRSLPREGPGEPKVAYYLAMSCHRLGRGAEARAWLDRAAKWLDGKGPGDQELLVIRQEARRCLETP